MYETVADEEFLKAIELINLTASPETPEMIVIERFLNLKMMLTIKNIKSLNGIMMYVRDGKERINLRFTVENYTGTLTVANLKEQPLFTNSKIAIQSIYGSILKISEDNFDKLLIAVVLGATTENTSSKRLVPKRVGINNIFNNIAEFNLDLLGTALINYIIANIKAYKPEITIVFTELIGYALGQTSAYLRVLCGLFLFNYISIKSEHIKGYFDRAKSSLLSILTSCDRIKESISKFIREKLKTHIDNATKELIEKTKTANESAEKAREEYKKFLGKGFDSMKELLKGSVEEDVINSLENTKEHVIGLLPGNRTHEGAAAEAGAAGGLGAAAEAGNQSTQPNAESNVRATRRNIWSAPKRSKKDQESKIQDVKGKSKKHLKKPKKQEDR